MILLNRLSSLTIASHAPIHWALTNMWQGNIKTTDDDADHDEHDILPALFSILALSNTDWKQHINTLEKGFSMCSFIRSLICP